MKTKRLVRICLGLTVCLMLVMGSVTVQADEDEYGIKAPLLNGEWWNKLTPGEKVAYIWGAGDVVDLEQEFMAMLPELKVENFSAKAAEGIGDVEIEDIKGAVDRFYAANPDKLDYTVLRVIWLNMIIPNLKTGIAGRPLE